MKTLLSIGLAGGLVMLSAHGAQAGALLTFSYAYSYDYGSTVDNGTGNTVNSYTNNVFNNMFAVSGNQTTSAVKDAGNTAGVGSISARNRSYLSFSPTKQNFTQVVTPATAVSAAAIFDPSTGTSYTYDFGYSYSIFTLTTPTNYTETVHRHASSKATADSASRAIGSDEGAFALMGPSGYVNYGYDNTVTDTQSGGSSTYEVYFDGTTLHTGNYPSLSFSGLLQPGQYYLESYANAWSYATGDSGSASSTAGQDLTLDLTPAPSPSPGVQGPVHPTFGPSAVPEPASIMLLATAGLMGFGYCGWRRRK